jgi:hypothetical protein
MRVGANAGRNNPAPFCIQDFIVGVTLAQGRAWANVSDSFANDAQGGLIMEGVHVFEQAGMEDKHREILKG